jgi:uncharacterized protein (DUF2267 family)
MSALGLEVFDRTFQTTNIWLDEIMEKLGPDRQIAWKVLSTVLHKLRDMLQPDLAAHLGAQLPLLVRGVYYDLYEPSKQPAAFRSREDFVPKSRNGCPTCGRSTRCSRSKPCSEF